MLPGMKPTLDERRAPVVVARFFPAITRDEVRQHFRELEQCAQRHGRIGVVVDLSEAPTAPIALGRAAADDMRELFRRSGERVAAVAHVAPSPVTRTLLLFVQTLAPPPFPSTVSPSMERALEWVEMRLRPLVAAKGPESSDARTAPGLARTLVDSARAQGVDVEAVLASWGLGMAELSGLDGYVAYQTLMRMVVDFAERSGDEGFGLHTAEQFVDASTFGLVGFVARSSLTLREAIERTARYAALMNENTQVTVTPTPKGLRIVDGPIPPLEWPRQYAELSMASWVTLARKWVTEPFSAVEVGFRHARPKHATEHQRIFGCMPRFDQPENVVVIPNAVLDLPLLHGDALLAEFLDAQLDLAARRRASAPGPLAQVREAVGALLPLGLPTLEAVGRRLAMSERTLQRRLAERGVGFADMLDSVRREAALRGVNESSVQELATACGFSDIKAFRRAFQRWTGLTPAAYRSAAATWRPKPR